MKNKLAIVREIVTDITLLKDKTSGVNGIEYFRKGMFFLIDNGKNHRYQLPPNKYLAYKFDYDRPKPFHRFVTWPYAYKTPPPQLNRQRLQDFRPAILDNVLVGLSGSSYVYNRGEHIIIFAHNIEPMYVAESLLNRDNTRSKEIVDAFADKIAGQFEKILTLDLPEFQNLINNADNNSPSTPLF